MQMIMHSVNNKSTEKKVRRLEADAVMRSRLGKR